MRIDHVDPSDILISISDENLKNLIKFRKLVKMGGSPRYPDATIEITVETDESHESSTHDQFMENE